MNWFKNIVPPGIKKIFKKRDVPDNLWLKCTACDSMIFHTDAEESLFVCPECDYHLKVSAEIRFSQLFDEVHEVVVVPKRQMVLVEQDVAVKNIIFLYQKNFAI